MVMEWIKGVVKGVFNSQVGEYVYPAAVIVVGATMADPVRRSPIKYPVDLLKGFVGKIL